MKKIFSILAVVVFASSTVFAQSFDKPSGWDSVVENDWQVSVFIGELAGDRITVANNGGEDVKISDDDGTIIGARFGKDVEYWGWEVSFAGAFSDEDYESFDSYSSGDATLLMADFDFLYYPAGYDFAGETFRPFLCAGPGAAHYMGDSDYVDDDTLYGYNIGCGVKLGLGEDLPELRVDYRWHFLGNDDIDDQERTEFTVGLGWKF